MRIIIIVGCRNTHIPGVDQPTIYSIYNAKSAGGFALSNCNGPQWLNRFKYIYIWKYIYICNSACANDHHHAFWARTIFSSNYMSFLFSVCVCACASMLSCSIAHVTAVLAHSSTDRYESIMSIWSWSLFSSGLVAWVSQTWNIYTPAATGHDHCIAKETPIYIYIDSPC